MVIINIFLNLIGKGNIIAYDLRKCNEPFNKYKGHEGNSINSIDFMKKENVIEIFLLDKYFEKFED